MARILTLLEFQVVYKLGEKTARRMCQRGDVPAFKAGGRWRVVDIGEHHLQLAQRQAAFLEATPFIRGCEVADLMNVSERRLRRLAELGRLQYQMRGARRVYSLESVEAYMSRRHGGHRKEHHKDIRPWVRRWAREMLAKTLSERGMPVPDFLLHGPSENPPQKAV